MKAEEMKKTEEIRTKEIEVSETKSAESKTEKTKKGAETLKQEIVKADINKVSAVQKKLYVKLNKQIANAYASAEKAFFSIACALYEINEKTLFRADSYKNITDFSSSVYDMKSSQTYAYISIVKRFGDIQEDASCASLKPEFADFTPSKLVKMLEIPDEYLSEVKSDWTVKQIVEYKNKVKDAVIIDSAVIVEQEELPLNDPEPEQEPSEMPYDGLDISPDDNRAFIGQFEKPEEMDNLKSVLSDTLNAFSIDKNFEKKKFHFEVNLCWE